MQLPESSDPMTMFLAGADKRLTILLAQQFFLERDALARVIAIVRPLFTTIDCTPELLDEVAVAVAPDVIISNTLISLTHNLVPVRIHLNIVGSAQSVVWFYGERTAVTNLGLTGILATLDRANRLRASM